MPDIQTLDDLMTQLGRAAQLEHATIPVYLTALYSLHPQTNRETFEILRAVVVEEMLHLSITANLLNAVGGTLDLLAPGFVPDYPCYLPDGESDFEIGLLPFGQQALDLFLKVERPSVSPSGAPTPTSVQRDPTKQVLGAHLAEGRRYYSIGDFYAAIEEGMIFLEREANQRGGTIFTGDPARQITADYYYSGGGVLEPITTLAQARAALNLVIEQGEGEVRHIHDARGEIAHYYRFEQLKIGQYYQPGDSPGEASGPPIEIDWQAIYAVKDNVKLADLTGDPALHDAALRFNAEYRRFLGLLNQAFNGQPDLLIEAVGVMLQLRNAFLILVRNPLSGTPWYAGPTFELQ